MTPSATERSLSFLRYFVIPVVLGLVFFLGMFAVASAVNQGAAGSLSAGGLAAGVAAVFGALGWLAARPARVDGFPSASR